MIFRIWGYMHSMVCLDFHEGTTTFLVMANRIVCNCANYHDH